MIDKNHQLCVSCFGGVVDGSEIVHGWIDVLVAVSRIVHDFVLLVAAGIEHSCVHVASLGAVLDRRSETRRVHWLYDVPRGDFFHGHRYDTRGWADDSWTPLHDHHHQHVDHGGVQREDRSIYHLYLAIPYQWA